MFEAFSESSRKIIFLARYEAGRLKHDYIDVPHFLLGFILEDQGNGDFYLQKSFGMEAAPASELLQSKKKDSFLDQQTAANLLDTLSIFGLRAEPQPIHGDMLLTEGAQSLLKAAFEHANGSQVTPLHLLWAMFSDETSSAAKALTDYGITREQVDQEIRKRKSA